MISRIPMIQLVTALTFPQITKINQDLFKKVESGSSNESVPVQAERQIVHSEAVAGSLSQGAAKLRQHLQLRGDSDPERQRRRHFPGQPVYHRTLTV